MARQPRTLASCSREILDDAQAGIFLQAEGRQSEARRLRRQSREGRKEALLPPPQPNQVQPKASHLASAARVLMCAASEANT